MIIDLRSDTVTKPCRIMREVMAKAEVGDDVYGEDPTINKLEEMSANLFKMDGALFVPSGTMANQLAILAHTSRSEGIILEETSHIYAMEVAGISVLAGVLPSIIRGNKGKITPEQVKNLLKPPNLHYPRNTLLCLENTHNFSRIVSIQVSSGFIGKQNGRPTHHGASNRQTLLFAAG